MSQSLASPHHEALRAYIVEKRKKAGLTQIALGKKLGRNQSYITDVETGGKVVDVVELMAWAKAIGFDPNEAINMLKKVRG